MEKDTANYEALNVGTGRNTTVKGVAEILIEKLTPDSQIKPKIEFKFREGDIRHCYADISKITDRLGYKPGIMFEDGIEELANWVKGQSAEDGFEKARSELEKFGLAH